MNKKRFSVRLLTEIAVFTAVGFVLDFIQGIVPQFWPSGGSIGISMCSVFVICFRRGCYGMLVGLFIGFLSMINNLWISPFAETWYEVFFQLFLDYFGAWMLVGLAGLFAHLIRASRETKKRITFVVIACTVGGFAKFLMHFISGMLFWPADDVSSQVIYSLVYNGSYMFANIILCAIIMAFVVVKAPSVIFAGYEQYNDNSLNE